jgi:hypothetical protein
LPLGLVRGADRGDRRGDCDHWDRLRRGKADPKTCPIPPNVRTGSARLQKSGRALGEEFIGGVFEEEAFEEVARVTRGEVARNAFEGDVAAFAYDAEREAMEERARS